MKVEVYERGEEIKISIAFNGHTRVLTREEALELSQAIYQALEGIAMKEGEKMWLLIAGQDHGQVVHQIIGDFEALQSNAYAMARMHKAAIWAVSFDYMTGILAWPRVELTPSLRLATIKEFVERVNTRAEQNIEKTGRLEGAHYAAMQTELAAFTGSEKGIRELR